VKRNIGRTSDVTAGQLKSSFSKGGTISNGETKLSITTRIRSVPGSLVGPRAQPPPAFIPATRCALATVKGCSMPESDLHSRRQLEGNYT